MTADSTSSGPGAPAAGSVSNHCEVESSGDAASGKWIAAYADSHVLMVSGVMNGHVRTAGGEDPNNIFAPDQPPGREEFESLIRGGHYDAP